MPEGQILTTTLYLCGFIALSYITGARRLRIAGAVAGGAVAGIVALVALYIGEDQDWWRVPNSGLAHFRTLFWLSFAVSCAPIYLIVWRVVRRFGGRGLTLCAGLAAVIGPSRDYIFAVAFPAWIVFSPGVLPAIAAAIVYVLLMVVGYAAMRAVAGPATRDELARRS